MRKIIRRYVWLTTAFFKQYLGIIIIGLLVSLFAGTIVLNVLSRLPTKKTTFRIGLIGVYNSNNLPQLVKAILAAGITTVGPNQTIVNNLSTKLEISPDEKTYIYHFKDGLNWNSDTPFKSTDINLTIPSVKTSFPTDNSISFELPEKFSPFPSLLINPITDKSGDLVSNFKIFLSQNTNGNLTRIELTSNDLKLIIKIFPNVNQVITAYRLGEVDTIFGLISNPENDYKEDGHIEQTVNFNQSVVLFFNTQDPSLKDRSVRQAIAYAIKDKSPNNHRSLGPINPLSWAYNPLVKTYDFDSTKAKKYLKDISIELAAHPQFMSLAENIKKDLEEIGVAVNLKISTSRPSNFQIYLSLFDSPIDPDQYIHWHSTQSQTNKSLLDNDKIDKLLEDGRRTLSISDRKRIYAEFQRTFSEELPALFLYHPRYLNLTRNPKIFEIINPSLAF